MSKILVDEITTRDGTSTLTLGASGKTLSIPSGCTISNSGTASGFSKVAQVLSTTLSSTVSISSSSTSTFVDISGLSVNITPTSTSSKILIFYVVHAAADTGSRHIRLMRDSTAISIGDAAGSSQIRSTSSARPSNAVYDYDTFNMAGQFLDSPSSSSQLTYKMQATLGATYSGTFYVNRARTTVDADYSPVLPSTITAMEILA